MNEYRVELDVFNGPLDLLLYLVRRDEIDLQDVSVARIADQYLEYLRLLQTLDPNLAADFLVMATTLVELKSRALLPTPPLEPLEESDDPRAALVRQLLEYKRFKDAARGLGRAAEERARRFVRRPANLPKELAGVELEDVQIWDLLTAFGRVMTAIGQGPGFREIRYDDTPIEQFAAQILERLDFEGISRFDQLFPPAAERGEIIGLFLALLELIRQRRMQARQERIGGAIFLIRLEDVDTAESRDDMFGELDTATEQSTGGLIAAADSDIVEYASADAAWVDPQYARAEVADDSESIAPGGDPPVRHAVAPHREGDLEDGEGEYA